MINTLILTNFRNHESSRINTNGAGNIIITGPNGSGKTAILEAVSMLSGNGGLRGAALDEILRFDVSQTSNLKPQTFSVFAELSDDTTISVSWDKNDTNRRAKIDGDNAPLSELGARMKIVWLTPREDRVFIEGASERRAFFDRLISNMDSKHAGHVARLSKLLSERAFALKTNADPKWTGAIESQIAPLAVAVAVARIKYAGEINYFLGAASVSVSGMIENILLGINTSAQDAEKEYLKYLSGNRVMANDKQVIDGAHKSDFGVFNKVLNLPTNIISTGQQKSVLVDLILAHAKLIKTKTNKTPIVLLDEAAAHLDGCARARMFAELGSSGAQVWATGIDRSVFADVPNAVFISCDNGKASISERVKE